MCDMEDMLKHLRKAFSQLLHEWYRQYEYCGHAKDKDFLDLAYGFDRLLGLLLTRHWKMYMSQEGRKQ